MGINQIQVMPRERPQAQQQHKDNLDRILEGLQIANGIMGIGVNYTTIQNHMKQNDLLDQESQGLLGPKDRATMMEHGLQPAEAGTPGAQNFRFKTGKLDDNGEPVVEDQPFILKGVAAKANYHPLPNYVDQASGKRGTAFFDLNDPTKGPAFIAPVEAPEKPAKEPTPHYVFQPDSSGTLYRGNTLTGELTPAPGADGANFKKGKPEDEEKTYSEIASKMEPTRGNRALQQASVNLLSVDNAERLMAPYANNLDKMPPKKVELLAEELEKIASGSAGTQSGRDSLAAKTFASKWSEFKSNLTGEPTGADVGAFLKDYGDYLGDLKQASQNVVDKHYQSVWNANKNRLSPELQDRFRQEMPDYFSWDSKKPGSSAPKLSAHGTDTSGTAVAAPGGAAAGPSAQDIEAELARRGIKVAPAAAPMNDIPDRPQGRSSTGGL